MELAHRNAALGYRTRFDANATANYEALEIAAGGACDCRSCRGGSIASTSRRSRAARRWRRWWCAKKAACARASTGNSRSRRTSQAPSPGPKTHASERFLDDFAAMEQVGATALCEGAREWRTVSRSDRDRWRQGAAERGLCGARNRRACRISWPSAWRRKRSWSSRATAWSRSRSIRTARAAAVAAHSRRGASLCDHVPSAVAQEARSAVGARRRPGIGLRRRKTLLTALRQSSRAFAARREKSWQGWSGVKVADAVIAHLRGESAEHHEGSEAMSGADSPSLRRIAAQPP